MKANRLKVWIVLLMATLLAACGQESSGEVDLGDPETLGERTFLQWCAPCHGQAGEGYINALDAPAINAEGETYLLSDEEIMAAIIDGGAESEGKMTPLGDFLAEEQEIAVLYYLHSLWTPEQQAAHEATGGHIPPPTPVSEP